MIPDYTKRLSDLLIRVIIHLLKHHSLDILSFATVRLIPKKIFHDVFFLPKWAPDWRETSSTVCPLRLYNFLLATDPSQRFMADFSRIWKQVAASRKPEAIETTSTGQQTELADFGNFL
jgi:hypothetical protein